MSAITTTYLQMLSPDQLRPKRSSDPRFRIAEATVKQWQFNRFLYSLVGQDWTWHDKLMWTDEQWRSYAEGNEVRTFLAYYDGSPAGYYELRTEGDSVEIAYFGLAAKFIGRGFGGPLLTSALEEAWRGRPKRVWLHTCSLDHPVAVANYQARGMTIYQVETKEA